jgi:transcriptional regulator with XRE-family HTH domain
VSDPLEDRLLFAGTLRRLMEASGVSGVEVARQVGSHPTSVSRWRTGEDRPRPEIVAKLADVFGVDRLALLRQAGYAQFEDDAPMPAPIANPRLSTLLAEIEAGWLAMDSEAERELAERTALALFAVARAQHSTKRRSGGRSQRPTEHAPQLSDRPEDEGKPPFNIVVRHRLAALVSSLLPTARQLAPSLR